MTIPPVPEPVPIEPEPALPDPDEPGRPPDPIDRGAEIDEELEETFPASDPPSGWAGPSVDA